MKQFVEEMIQLGAIIKPAKEDEIVQVENTLGFSFSSEYKDYLLHFGVISYDAVEVYGLGVPESSYLNILNFIASRKEEGISLPLNSIPLSEIGDGQYYLYNNESKKILIWSSATETILEEKQISLEAFLKALFS
ncbi:SMI1/KNR4 family protein [Avibacterium paragallinarum]|uniref:SMI1/KNR4 family protein n=1 Tax=Avibacterium paragallinarum TaxID=728 RepID=UPI00398775BC